RIIEAVDSKKWILKGPSDEPISPDQITTWSRLNSSSSFDFGAGCIVLIGGTRVPRARLVRAEPVAPAKTHTKTTSKQVNEEVLPAVLGAVMADGEKLPNDNEIIKPVNGRLELQGRPPADWKTIQGLRKDLLKNPPFSTYVLLKPGQHWPTQ